MPALTALMLFASHPPWLPVAASTPSPLWDILPASGALEGAQCSSRTSSGMLELPEALPHRTRLAVANLLEEEPASVEVLRQGVSSYLLALEAASEQNGLLDSETARALGEKVLGLIEACHASHPGYVHAAVSYFINSDDVEHDMDSFSGFNDDIEVLNAICQHLGRPDLRLLP